MSAFGGIGRESSCFVSKLVEKIAEKQGTELSVVANYVRSKISFEVVPCALPSRVHQRLKIQKSMPWTRIGDGGGQKCDRDQGIEGEDVVELCPEWMMEDI